MLSRLIGSIAFLACIAPAQAVAYPTGPITLTSPFPAGGGTDFIARTLAKKLNEQNGWTVVVDNKPGAAGTIGLNAAADTPANGHHIVLAQVDNLIIAPYVLGTSFSAIDTLKPVAGVAVTPAAFFIASDSPYQTLADVIQAAKSTKQPLSYGSPGAGSFVHLAAEVFQSRSGIELMHVPYKGAAPAFTDLIAGHIDMAGGSIASANAMLSSGRVRPLAVTSATRSSRLPDTPSVAEQGVNDFDVVDWYAIFSPAGVDDQIVETLNKAITQALTDPELIKAFGNQGLETLPLSAQDLEKLQKQDRAAWQDIISSVGLIKGN